MPVARWNAAIVVFVLLVAACGGGDAVLGGPAALGVAEGQSPDRDDASETTVPLDVAATPDGSTTTTAPTATADLSSGVVVVPTGGAPLSTDPEGTPFIQIHEGVTMGFTERDGAWLKVTTLCDDPAWVPESAVEVSPPGVSAPAGPGFDLSTATVVIDPGHGDRDWGGVGPNGLSEKGVNLDIAERVRELMASPHDVDWATGAVTSGDAIDPVGTVWMTRSRSGPNEGDFELTLGYRASLANAAAADAFVSIHNNTVPRIDTDIPGTEVYYAVGAEDSDRLAAILYEEMLRSVSAFEADWTGGEIMGARARIVPETGEDYYGILRRSTVPSAIVEGIYISEPDQEALLETEEFRQAYAEAVYRGIVRFLTTNDSGTGLHSPEPFDEPRTTAGGSGCELPAQQ